MTFFRREGENPMKHFGSYLTIAGTVPYVHHCLEEDLPNIREHMVQLVTGQQGHTHILRYVEVFLISHNVSLPFSDVIRNQPLFVY